MSGWTNDTEDVDESDEGESESPEIPDFPKTFEKAVRGSNDPSEISESQLFKHIDEVDDEDLLREAWLQYEGEKQNIVENQIEEIGGSTPDGEGNSETGSTSGEAETSGSDDDSGWGGSDPEEDEGNSDSQDTSEDSSDTSEDDQESESDSSDEDSGWGDSGEEEDDSEAAEPAIESAEEIEDDDEAEEDESAENESSSDSGQSSGPPTPESAISPDALMERDRRWKIMTWGPPKLFKTHFAYTMPEPIAYIDTEGKADDILSKFDDKTIQFWRPKEMEADPDTKFRRVKKALDEALEWLDWYRENEGKVGTIVVDSMTLIWEWAQRQHKIENYPMKDPEDIELSSNFKSSQESDWAVVKEYHNGEFRERITDSDYHFYWTCMQRVAFEDTFDEDENIQIYEPRGEPNNDHKVDTIIRARKDNERGKVGDLVGSNFTDNVFVGLEKPTFPKVKDAINTIEEQEGSDQPKSRGEVAEEIDAEAVIDYDPQRYTN